VIPDVTLISPYPSPREPGASGVAWYTRCLARALADAGAHVEVLAPASERDRGTDHDGPVRVFRPFRRGATGAARAAAAAVATRSPVVHLQHEAFLYGGPESVPSVLMGLARLRRAGRGPAVTMHQVVDPATVDRRFTEIHGVSLPAPVARAALTAMQSSIASLAQRVIVHEDDFCRTVPGAVRFPLGANLSAPPTARVSPRAAELRSSHRLRPEQLVVLCFGFVAPYKGLEVALQAARMAGPEVALVVAGGEHPRLAGNGYYESLRRTFGDTAAFTGFVDDGDVAAWFAASDAVLLPYPQPFSSSGVLADALAHDAAALVSAPLARVVGLPEEIAVPLDPSGLAARLLELARDRSQLDRLRAAVAGLQEGRSWPELAHRHLGLYGEVIDAQRLARRPVRLGPRR
jgi:glycosyltransferase involved in cell wall biosynthesis